MKSTYDHKVYRKKDLKPKTGSKARAAASYRGAKRNHVLHSKVRHANV